MAVFSAEQSCFFNWVVVLDGGDSAPAQMALPLQRQQLWPSPGGAGGGGTQRGLEDVGGLAPVGSCWQCRAQPPDPE